MIILPALLQFNLRKTPLTKELELKVGFERVEDPSRDSQGQSPWAESRGRASGHLALRSESQ